MPPPTSLPPRDPIGTDAALLRQALLTRAASARPGASFCPSEVARAIAQDWRPLMDPVRQAAAALVQEGLLLATQRGVPVDPITARGPIRLRRSHD